MKSRNWSKSQNRPKWTEPSLQDRSLEPMNWYESPGAHPGQSDMCWPLYSSILTKLNLVLFRSKVCPSIINIWKHLRRVPNTTPVLVRSTCAPAELDPVRVRRRLGGPDPSIESSRRTTVGLAIALLGHHANLWYRGFRPILLSTKPVVLPVQPR